MTLLSPWWIIPAAALATAALLPRWNGHEDSWARVLSASVLRYLRHDGGGLAFVNLPLLIAALAALALSSPSVPHTGEQAFRHAEGWIVAIDVSKSMETNDILPNRLAVARDAAAKIADAASSKAVAMIVFAGDAYLAVPFSFDKQQFATMVQTLKQSIVPVEGSDPARALALSASLIGDGSLARTRVFLLSDGPKAEIKSILAAADLARKGHRLDVLTFARPETADPKPVDLLGAERLANAGSGVSLLSDPLGEIDVNALDLNEPWIGTSGLVATTLTTSRMLNQSHWLLLLLLPLLLLVFRRRMA